MNVLSEEERQKRLETRIMIYNQIQMVLSGHDAVVSLEALLETFAIVVNYIAKDLDSARSYISIFSDALKIRIDNNWDIVSAHKGQSPNDTGTS